MNALRKYVKLQTYDCKLKNLMLKVSNITASPQSKVI